MSANRASRCKPATLLLDSTGVDDALPRIHDRIDGLSALAPKRPPDSPAHGLDYKGLHDWFRARGVETWLHPNPVPLLRLSAQLYNDLDQFKLLARLLEEALHGR